MRSWWPISAAGRPSPVSKNLIDRSTTLPCQLAATPTIGEIAQSDIGRHGISFLFGGPKPKAANILAKIDAKDRDSHSHSHSSSRKCRRAYIAGRRGGSLHKVCARPNRIDRTSPSPPRTRKDQAPDNRKPSLAASIACPHNLNHDDPEPLFWKPEICLKSSADGHSPSLLRLCCDARVIDELSQQYQ